MALTDRRGTITEESATPGFTDRRLGATEGVAVKLACRVATTGNITLSGEQTVDGVACVENDRILVRAQTSSINNGIYVVQTGDWIRAKDFNGHRDVAQGTRVLVISGSTYALSDWYVTTADPILVGTDAITFAEYLDIGITVQAWDADLDAIAALSGTGVALRTGSNTWSLASTSAALAAALSDETGTGALVFGTSPTLTTSLLLGSGFVIDWNSADLTLTHSANALTLAGGTLVLPASGLQVGSSNPFSDSSGTLTLQNVDALDATTEATIEAAIDTLANLTSVQGHTVTLTGAFIRSGAHSLTFTTTGTTSVTLPTTGTLATLSNHLGQFGNTTSAQLAGVISDETGSGALVFGTSPSLTTPSFSSYLQIAEIASPANPAADNIRLFAKDVAGASHLFQRDSAGTEVDLTAGAGGASAATQAEQEAASSTSVFTSPGRQHYHPGHPKGWVGFVGTGTPTAAASHNLSSITDVGTGIYTLNLTTSFSSAAIGALVGAAQADQSASANYGSVGTDFNRAASAFAAGSTTVGSGVDATSTRFDPTYMMCAVYGDQ